MLISNEMNTSNKYVKYRIAVTQNSKNRVANTSNVTVSVRFYTTDASHSFSGNGTVTCNIDGITYTENVTKDQRMTNDGIVLFAKTLDTTHDTDGAKTLTCSAAINLDIPLTSVRQSYSMTLSPIANKSTLIANEGILGEEQTLIIQSDSSDLTHTIVASCKGLIYTVCHETKETMVSFTPPLDWAEKYPNENEVVVRYVLYTYDGDTEIGSNMYDVKYSIPSSVKPKCRLVLSDPTGNFEKYGGYVKGRSKIRIQVQVETAYNSNISKYDLYVVSTFTGNKHHYTTDITLDLDGEGQFGIVATVVDSRNRSATDQKTINILDYTPPIISMLSAERCDSRGASIDTGEYIKVTFSGKVSSLNGQNTASYSVSYKKTNGSDREVHTITSLNNVYDVSDYMYIFKADTKSTYIIDLNIGDKFEAVSSNTVASVASTIIHFKSDGNGMGIGKVCDEENTLDVGYRLRLSGGISPIELPTHTDLNWIKTGGVYMLRGYNDYINCPISRTDGILIVIDDGYGVLVHQKIIRYASDKPGQMIAYERCGMGGVDHPFYDWDNGWVQTVGD